MTVEKDFPQPPGGKLICEIGQTAIIRIRKGVITASCTTPPANISIRFGRDYSPEFKQWLVAIVKKETFRRFGKLTTEDEAIFLSREYEYLDHVGTKVRVEFKPPLLDQIPDGGGQSMSG